MRKLISAKLAGNLLLISMLLLILLHILILFKIVPSDIVWGGQIGDSSSNLFIFEIIALAVTLIFTFIIAVKAGYIGSIKFRIVVNVGIWIIFAYFILNTIGNLASAVSVENLIFAPFTVLLAFLAFRLAIEK